MLKTTVIVISYNLEKYVAKALESVYEQDLQPDEVILADDNSTDSTLEIVSRQYPQVKIVINEFHKGALLNAWNAFLHASHDIVFFLDADDVWCQGKIRLCCKEYLSNPNLVLLSHSHRRVSPSLGPLSVVDATHINIRNVFKMPCGQVGSRLRESVLFRMGYWLGSAYSVRSSAVCKSLFSGLVFSSPIAKYGYLDLVLGPFVAASNPYSDIGYLPNHFFLYRIHSLNSASGVSTDGQMRVLRKMMAVELLTSRVLKASTLSRSIVVRRFFPSVAYLKYLRLISRGKYLLSLKYLLLARSRVSVLRFGFAKEILRILFALLGLNSFLLRLKKTDLCSFPLIRAFIR